MGITVAELVSKFDADTGDFTKKLDGIEKSLGQMSEKGQKHTGLLGSSFLGLAGKAGGLFAALKGFEFGKDAVFGFNAQLDSATRAFSTMLGSGEKAESFMKDLRGFAKTTPFEFPELVDASQRFTAMGFAADDVLPSLRSIGDATAALGGGKEIMNGLITALGQIKAKGKVSAEEMMQLSERGVPAWQFLADAIGVTVPEAMKLAEKGAINADQAIGAILEGMDGKFGGMMEGQSRSFKGAMSNIKDSARDILATSFRPLYKGVESLTVKLADFMASKRFTQWMDAISNTIKGFIGKVTMGVEAFIQFLKLGEWEAHGFAERVGVFFANLVRQVIDLFKMFKSGEADSQGFAEILDNMLGNSGKLVPVFRTMYEVVDKGIDIVKGIVEWSRKHADILKIATATAIAFFAAHKAAKMIDAATAALKAYNVVLKTNILFLKTHPMIIWVTAIVAAAAALYMLYKRNETFRNAVDKMARTIRDFAKSVWPDFINGLKEVGRYLKETYEKVFPKLRDAAIIAGKVTVKVFEAIVKASMKMYHWLKENVWPVFTALGDLMGAVTKRVMQQWNMLWTVMRPILELMWSHTKTVFGIIAKAISAFFDVAWPAFKLGWDAFVTVLKIAWDIIKGVVETGLAVIKGIIKFVTAVIEGDWSKAWEAVKETFTKVFGIIKKTAESVLEDIFGFFKRLPGRIEELIEGIQKAGAKVGKAILDGVLDGVKAVGSFAWDFAKAFGSAVRNFIDDKVMGPVRDAIRSLADGLASVNIPGVGRAFDGASSGLNKAAGMFSLPTFHTGGIVPGLIGQERIIKAQAGEAVLSIKDTKALLNGVSKYSNGSNQNTQPIQVNVTLDKRVLATAMADVERMYR
jgi:tape measure domain-containing protein